MLVTACRTYRRVFSLAVVLIIGREP